MFTGFAQAVLITMIFQYCAKIKATKSLVHKKVDRCSPWAWVGWGGADTTTAPLLSTGLSMQMSGLLVTLITTAMSKPKERVFFFLIMLIDTRFRNKSGW